MRARGVRTARARVQIGTALAVALGGTALAFATPAEAAPEGPDRGQETVADPVTGPTFVDAGLLGAASMARSRVAGVPPGLVPLRPGQTWIFLDGR